VMGLIVAGVRIMLELKVDSLTEGSLLHTFASTNFLTFAAWFFGFCIIWCVSVSLMTPAPDPASIQGLTMGSLSEEQKEANRNSYNVWDIVFSLLVIAIVAYVMISFTG
jgi:solute:Na+ symporter, SSS family